MSSSVCYLRVEAVNLDNFVYDTNNLSVIRGGGLMLLEIPRYVEELLEKYKEDHPDEVKSVETISQGASWGLFCLELEDEGKDSIPKGVARFIEKGLKEDKVETLEPKKIQIRKDGKSFERNWPEDDKKEVRLTPRHATVMVEVSGLHERGSDFTEIKEGLTALCRFHQMCSPSISFPSLEKKPVKMDDDDTRKERRVCELDLVRPAAEKSEHQIKGKARAVSSSSYARYKYGAFGKSDFWYEEVTGLKGLPLFAHHFNEIADNLQEILDPEEKSSEISRLEGKMAVIYLDGNHFGKLQREKCKTPKIQQEFDEKLRKTYQADALKHLIETIRNDQYWINPRCWFPGAEDDETTQKIRLETLLWGGDEVIFVAPAWRGWWLLGKYFSLVEGGLERNPWEFQGEKLTFGAGMVFCHNTAPIYRIKQIAFQLAEEAKRVSRKENLAAVQVLESYDLVGTDFERFRKKWHPPAVSDREMLFSGKDMLEIAAYFQELKDEIPRRRLYMLIEALWQEEDFSRIEKTITAELSPEATNCLECLSSCFESLKAMWYHIHELWDYLIMPSHSKDHEPCSK